ncbi:MAG: hypothetical protein AB7O43_21070 [Hyphomicrobiaceae bacterium]
MPFEVKAIQVDGGSEFMGGFEAGLTPAEYLLRRPAPKRPVPSHMS